MPGLELRELDIDDADQWIALVLRNRDPLTASNDGSLPPSTMAEVRQWLSSIGERDFQPGIWLDGELIGHVMVSHISHARASEQSKAEMPGSFGVGYWLDSVHTGRGYVTEACRTLMDYVRREFGATQFVSAVKEGNPKSAAVLERLGFEVTQNSNGEMIGYRLVDPRSETALGRTPVDGPISAT